MAFRNAKSSFAISLNRHHASVWAFLLTEMNTRMESSGMYCYVIFNDKGI